MTGITNETEPYFKDGVWGWDGTQWRKLALVFGYSDRWAEAAQGAATGAGNATASTATVPSGYVYVVQAISAYHNAVANKVLTLQTQGGGTSVAFAQEAGQPPNLWLTWTGTLVLKEDDYIQAVATAPGDGKIVYLRVWGYKMAIAE